MPFPIDSKQIHDTETKLSITFPSSFRGKMINENGGDFESDDQDWFLFPFLDTTDKKRLARTCNDIVRETKAARKMPGFPANAVAIGNNGGGDLLLFLPKDDAPRELGPAVFWWDHETDKCRKVADDFAELL